MSNYLYNARLISHIGPASVSVQFDRIAAASAQTGGHYRHSQEQLHGNNEFFYDKITAARHRVLIRSMCVEDAQHCPSNLD